MKCPNCKIGDLKVTDSRPVDDYTTRRRRECLRCLERFTSYETVLPTAPQPKPVPVVVIDGVSYVPQPPQGDPHA